MQSSNKGFKPKSKRKHVEGKISGPGTGTSDDIKAQVPAGSYIMPADSTKAIGEQNLAGMGAPVDVNVSNGEFALPPEQVHAVGVQALRQMRDQTHTPTGQPQVQGSAERPELFFADGDLAEDPKRKEPTLASVANGGPGTVSLGPFNISHLPNYGSRNSAGPAKPEGPPAPQPPAQPSPDTNSGQTERGFMPSSSSATVPTGQQEAAPAQAGQPQEGSGGFFRGVRDLYTGAAKTGAGIIAGPFAYAADSVRSGAANLFGGDPDTLPGGRDKYYSAAGESLGSGVDDLKRVGSSVQAVGRDLLGVQQAPQPLAEPQPSAAAQATAQQGQQSAPAAVTDTAQQPGAQQAVDAQVQPQAAVDPAQAQVDPAQFAGMANNITRVGNSFSAEGPIREGYTINGQPQGGTNIIPGAAGFNPNAQSAQNIQAKAALFDRTPEFGTGTAPLQQQARGFNPSGGGTRFNVIRDTSRDERERRQLWNAASTAHRGAQNGQLTAAQINAMRGMRNDERTAENNRYATDAGLTREGMSQAGADRRAASRDAIDMRRVTGEEESRGFQNRAAARMESLYDQLDKAAPEDRPAIEEQLRILSGGSKASENLSNNFIKVKQPVYDERGNIIGEQDVPIDLRQFGQQQQAALPPLESNPAVQQILNNTRLSKEERARQIRALGYQ